MFRVNKKIEYGIHALLHLANKTDQTACVREISSESFIPEALLGKIMQSLKNAGLVKAIQGTHGGYQLDRELQEINLLELTEILVGPIAVAECLEPKPTEKCSMQPHCKIAHPMANLNQKIIRLFQSMSIEELAQRKGFE